MVPRPLKQEYMRCASGFYQGNQHFPLLREHTVIDPRGTRFSAAVTSLVLAVVIVTTPGPIAGVLISLQTLVFAFGAFLGPNAQPYSWVFKALIRPRLGAPSHTEDALPPQFAQAVGLLFALSASVSMLFAWTPGVWIFAGFALFAAALNAIFGFCLGCEIYLRLHTFMPAEAVPDARSTVFQGHDSATDSTTATAATPTTDAPSVADVRDTATKSLR